MHKIVVTAVVFAGATASMLAFRTAAEPSQSKHSPKSGYVFASPETRRMMDDDFENPASLWIEKGRGLWSSPDGAAKASCATCHGDASQTMKGVAASFPRYDPAVLRVIDLAQRINLCRTRHMGAQELAWESEPLLSLTGYVAMQSRGMPVHVMNDGPAQASWERGKIFYYQRRGQLDLSCANCHIDNEGRKIRSETLSQGQINGFPLYRLKWQSFGSVHRRFAGCNEEIRAEPYPIGSDQYVDLELYVAWRGNGLPMESPAVRK